MDTTWVQLIGAAGLGAIATKLLDIVWLQRELRRRERSTWLRENRLRAFSALARELMSMGLEQSSYRDQYSGLALSAETVLLLDDERLVAVIESFFSDITSLPTKWRKLEEELGKSPQDMTPEEVAALATEFARLQQQSREIVLALRQQVLE